MKASVALVLMTLIAGTSGDAYAQSTAHMTIKKLKNTVPCKPSPSVQIVAYLQSSRHGSLLSQGPGTNSEMIDFDLSGSLDQSKNRLFFRHLFDPRIYMNSLFKATFSGSVKCNSSGAPIFHVESVGDIYVSQLREAR